MMKVGIAGVGSNHIPKVIQKMMEPITVRNDVLTTETLEEKTVRLKNKFGLHHGKGKRKKRK